MLLLSVYASLRRVPEYCNRLYCAINVTMILFLKVLQSEEPEDTSGCDQKSRKEKI